MGNLTRVRNLAAVGSPRWMGGATDSSFTYDDLNRLTGAEGFFQRPRSKGERFELDVEYDSIHNIVAMRRLHQTLQPRGRAW